MLVRRSESAGALIALLADASSIWWGLLVRSYSTPFIGRASLQGARLDRASLTDVDFSGADISTASFHAATLTRVTMRGARAMQAGGDMSPR